jgi:predicted ABC-type ATPase
MPPPPELWIVAGPNGAGKTTCVQREPIASLLPSVTFLNPDDRTLSKLRAAGYRGFSDTPTDVLAQYFTVSATEVAIELDSGLDRGMAMGVETVLSTEKYEATVRSVIARGGFVGLIYVALSSPAIARDRVAARVRNRGHDVPEDKIAQRWQRSLNHLGWFLERVSVFWIVDNSDSNPDLSPRLLARGKSGQLEFLTDDAFPEMKAALGNIPRLPQTS